MKKMLFDTEKIMIAVGQTLFAILAACAKWLNTKNGKQQKTLLAEAIGAMVAGGTVFFFYMATNINVYVCFILSGLLGMAGTKGIEAFGNYFIKKATGIPIAEIKKEKADDDG